MESESGVTRSIIDELHSSDIQRDEIDVESGVIRSIIDELHSWDLQGEQTADESGASRGLIDELHCADMQVNEMERKSGVTRSINMNCILRISKEIKYNVKVVLIEVSLLNFILWISNEIKR